MSAHFATARAAVLTFATVAVAAGLVALLHGGEPGVPPSNAAAENAPANPVTDLRVSPSQLSTPTEADFIGQNVRSSDGERLGSIRDVILEPRTGRIVVAAVSSGGFLGIADTVRVIPPSALRRDADGFLAAVTKAGWAKLPELKKEEFEAGNILLTPEQRDALAAQFGPAGSLGRNGAFTGPAVAAPPVITGAVAQHRVRESVAARAAAAAPDELMRASEMRGKVVRHREQDVGKIEAIVLDLATQRAAALLVSNEQITGREQRFLVPLNRLSFGFAQSDPVSTTLARADFVRALRAGASPGHAVSEDSTLVPTGRAPEDTTSRPSLAAATAAREIRRALDAHPALASAGIEVTSREEKVLLRGAVGTLQLKEDAEQIAAQRAGAVPLESEIAVRER